MPYSPSTDPFSSEEQTEIAGRVDEVKAHVRENFELTAAQLEGLERKLDVAVEASTLGRKDWVGYLLGAVRSTIIGNAIPPGVVQGVLGMLVHGVAHIFGLGLPPPAIPL